MNKTPKIMVLKLKELIYICIFIILAILLLVFLLKSVKSCGNNNDKPATSGNINKSHINHQENDESSKENSSESDTTKKYAPGIYTSSLVLNNSSLEVEVCVDCNNITSVSIKNMSEAITTMYPLMSSSIEDINNQIVSSQSLDDITYPVDSRYTYMVLIDSIGQALEKAKP